ncbi:MAG: hypothetical protein CSH37_14660 [Thalassolituus sp.]|nr:MAG: hypothetical protein CSH37_14660 [Thalassolituus sp.]
MNKYYLALLLCLAPLSALAHVRWFVPVGTDLPAMSLPSDWLAVLLVSGALMFMASVLVVARVAAQSDALSRITFSPWNSNHHLEWYLLFLLVNLVVIHNLLEGEFLGPHFFVMPDVMMIGVVLQALVLILSVVSLLLTGVVLLVIAFCGVVVFSFESGIDYFFEVAALGIAYILVSTRINALDRTCFARYELTRFADLAPTILGLQLITLAIHNKLYEPAATYFFLTEHPYYNFPQFLGWADFTHLHFALAAGVFEAAFGVMLMLGLATRYVLLVVSFFFISTGIISGLEEVMGHLPIFGVIAVLFVAGDRRSRDTNEAETLAPSPA